MSRKIIGKIRRENGLYIISPEFSLSSDGHSYGTYFKDMEAYEKDWGAPCYAPEINFDYCEETDEYETHNSLLKSCGYNEELCDCMFNELQWQSPETWLSELNEESYSFFWGWLKVGVKAFLWQDTQWQSDFYEVVKIGDKQECYNANTVVWISRKKENNHEVENLSVTLWQLAKTDISRKIAVKKSNYYHNIIKPGVKVWWNDPAKETSNWFYVDSVESDSELWSEDTIVWLKRKQNSKVPINQVLMQELFVPNKIK